MSDCSEDTYSDGLRQVTFSQIWDDIRHRLQVPRVDEEAVRGRAALTSAGALPPSLLIANGGTPAFNSQMSAFKDKLSEDGDDGDPGVHQEQVGQGRTRIPVVDYSHRKVTQNPLNMKPLLSDHTGQMAYKPARWMALGQWHDSNYPKHVPEMVCPFHDARFSNSAARQCSAR